jgi:hypothetical protein
LASREISKAENTGIRRYKVRAWRVPKHSDIVPEYAVGREYLLSAEMSNNPDERWIAQFTRIF